MKCWGTNHSIHNNKLITLAKERHEEEMKNINVERDARIAAIDDEIKALDALTRQKERGDKDTEELKEIGRLQARLDYAVNDEQRSALAKQIDALQKSREDRLFKQSIEDKKTALKEEQDLLKEQNKLALAELKETQAAELELLQEQNEQKLDEMELFYQKRALIEEAAATGSMDKILGLIGEYYPEYALTGQNLGATLLSGFDAGFLASLPEKMLEGFALLSPESEVGLVAVENAGALGDESGRAFGGKIEEGVTLYIDHIEDYFSRFIGSANSELDSLIEKAKSLSLAGAAGGIGSAGSSTRDRIAERDLENAKKHGTSDGIVVQNLSITSPEPVTTYSAMKAVGKASRELVIAKH